MKYKKRDAIKHLDKEVFLMCVGKETSSHRSPSEPKEFEPPTLALAGMTKTESESVLRQRELIIKNPLIIHILFIHF